MMRCAPSRRGFLAGLAGGALSVSARAAPAVVFYRGKTVNLVVGFAPGGAVDTGARVMARHLVRFLPGTPRIVVQNMEGAAGIICANYLYSRAKPDGLTVAVPGRSWFVEAAVQVQGVRFDATKFAYIGSPGAVNSVVYVRSATGVHSFEDLKASKRVLTFGALGNLAPTAMVPYLLAAQGLPVKVVLGYVSSNRIVLALEQGEVDGFFTVESIFGLRQELAEKKVIVPILQNQPIHPGIPLIRDVLPKSDGQLLNVVMALESFGLPLIAPPGVPPGRMAILRSAFDAMCADKQYRDDAAKADLPVGHPLDGVQLTAMMNALAADATPDIIARYRKLATPG
jgi:hypothetical protein